MQEDILVTEWEDKLEREKSGERKLKRIAVLFCAKKVGFHVELYNQEIVDCRKEVFWLVFGGQKEWQVEYQWEQRGFKVTINF